LLVNKYFIYLLNFKNKIMTDTIQQIKELAIVTDNIYLLHLAGKLEKEIESEMDKIKIETAKACINFGF